MSVMSDTEIKEAIKNKELLIEDFQDNLLAPASYDLRVGRRALKSIKDGQPPILNLEVERILQIGTGEFVELLTYERLELSNAISARFGLRSYFTRKGLILFAGPQIDPTFRGNLVVSLFNTGPRTVILKYGEPFCSIEFSRLGVQSERKYEGSYQNQTDFPSENIEFIVGAKGVTLYEVVGVMRGLQSDTRWMKWLLGFILAALIALILKKP